jgi:hypothetical protein
MKIYLNKRIDIHNVYPEYIVIGTFRLGGRSVFGQLTFMLQTIHRRSGMSVDGRP